MKHSFLIRIAAAALMTIVMGPLSSAQTQSRNSVTLTKWLLNYDEKSENSPNTPNVLKDPRFRRLLIRNFHQQAFFLDEHPPLWKIMEDFLGNGLTIKDHRYAVIDGCVHHMCPEYQGFLWVDTASGSQNVLFAALAAIPGEDMKATSPSLFHLWIFGNHKLRQDFVDNESLPDSFLYPMQDWIDRIGGRHVVSAMFVGPDGKMTPLLTSTLHLPDLQFASEVKTKEQQ